MKSKLQTPTLALAAWTTMIFVAAPALADDPCTTGTPGLDSICKSGGNPIYNLIQYIANWALGIIGIAAVLVVIVSGIQYIVSQGDPAAIKSAKNRLVNAVIGLFLLSIMFVILKFLGVSK